jgi:hypothetical protein
VNEDEEEEPLLSFELSGLELGLSPGGEVEAPADSADFLCIASRAASWRRAREGGTLSGGGGGGGGGIEGGVRDDVLDVLKGSV